ncbi:MAG: hypothetical protein GX577_04825 [Leptolinea sp.]|nr:hypothetical protein [Leptolinea sp.]
MTLIELAPYILIGLVLAINIVLWASIVGKKNQSGMKIWRNASFSLNKPWEKEEKELRELNDRVKSLKSAGHKSEKAQDTDANK